MRPMVKKVGHQLNVSMVQGDALSVNRAYLGGCSTVTAFKTDTRDLKGMFKTLQNRILLRINCNAGAVTRTSKMGSFG